MTGLQATLQVPCRNGQANVSDGKHAACERAPRDTPVGVGGLPRDSPLIPRCATVTRATGDCATTALAIETEPFLPCSCPR